MSTLSLCRSVPMLPAVAAWAVVASVFPNTVVAQQPANGGMLALPPAARPTPAASPAADTHYLPAKLLKRPPLPYPIIALLNRVEGVVKARFGIDDQGHVENVNAVGTSGSVLLDGVVLDRTLRDWTFQPATLDGKPIASSLEQEFEFRLDPEEQRRFARERLAAPVGLPDPPYPPAAASLNLKGSCTIGILWTERGLVDLIYLDKSTGYSLLDHVALRWAFTHWHIDPKDIVYPKDKDGKKLAFTKVVTFTPPVAGTTPPP